GQATPEKFIANIQSFITDPITKAPKHVNKETLIATIAEEKTAQSLGRCPGCHTGELVDCKTFIRCIAYKSVCQFSINITVAGRQLTDKNIKFLIEKGRTGFIKGFTSKGGKALTFKEGKVTFQFS
ncbi:MAG: topoisomerase C-terminal repeat-containing protein, partial [Lysinibacillus sp.]